MIFLLAFILPAAFLLYSVFSKDTSGTFTAFLLGVFSGLLALIVNSFFPVENLAYSALFWNHVWRIFLQYFLFNSVSGLIFFFLISFSLSGEALDTSFSAVFGIFSVVFIHLIYTKMAFPGGIEFILFLLVIIGAILIFDFVFNILIVNSAIPYEFLIYLISFIPFLLICFLGSVALGSWYLKGEPIFYIAVPAGICFVGTVLNAVVSRL